MPLYSPPPRPHWSTKWPVVVVGIAGATASIVAFAPQVMIDGWALVLAVCTGIVIGLALGWLAR